MEPELGTDASAPVEATDTSAAFDGSASDAASPSASHGRAFALYAVMIFGGLALVQVVLGAGRHLHGPKPMTGGGAIPTGGGAEGVVWKLLLASAVIIVVARLVGGLFERINQPQVVGEIVAGILLGPSVLGALWPHATQFLFSDKVLPYIDVLAQVGLIFFMFLIGLELDVRLLRGRGHAAATVSHVSIILPFLMGCTAALLLFPSLGSGRGKFTEFALFMGASMSITAFPVLARILTERGIYKTRLGAVTLTCAAIDDVTAWCMLAVVVAIARAHGAGSALVTIGLSILFISFMIVVVRPLLGRVAGYYEHIGQVRGGMLALLFVGVLLSALATDRIGIHAIFGAFLFGAVMPRHSELVAELTEKLEDFTVVFLLPLFFAFNGLRTDIGLLGSDLKLWGFCGLILAVAIIGKWGGSALAAKVMGLGWRESLGLGVLMNTRGLTELIILNIGLDLGVIPPALFAMLVIMALVTTFMTTPLLGWIYPAVQEEADAAAAAETEDGPRPFRVLVPVANVKDAQLLVHTALRLAREEGEQAHVTLLRIVGLPGSAFRASPRVQEMRMKRAADGLKPMVALVEGAGQIAVPLVIPSGDVADTIVRVANERQPDLVLLGWHRSFWGNNILGGAVGDVLRKAKADVAVVVDPAGTGLAIPKGGEILVPYAGGFHEDSGYNLAVRLADASDASVTLVGPEDEHAAEELGERAARTYEDSGVWATPVTVAGDAGESVVSHAKDADLVVLGVGDDWARDKRSLGGLREMIAARSTAPILLVRRHGQKRLSRSKEWLVDTGETAVVDLRDAGAASADQAAAAPAKSP
jgi:Kef-type K+ transport system membrane component KefB/nucleotide-binding universal stress UspA family protein